MQVPYDTIRETAPATAQPATSSFPLASLRLTFITLSGEKSPASGVGITLDNRFELMGLLDSGKDEAWGIGTHNGVQVPVLNRVDYYEAVNGRLHLSLQPGAEEDWTFDVRLDMTFEGGGGRWVQWSGLNVSHDRPNLVLTWV